MLIGSLSSVELPLGTRLLNDLGLDFDELFDSASLDALINLDFIDTSLAHYRSYDIWSTGGVKVLTKAERPAYVAVSSILSFALALRFLPSDFLRYCIQAWAHAFADTFLV